MKYFKSMTSYDTNILVLPVRTRAVPESNPVRLYNYCFNESRQDQLQVYDK